MTLIIVASNAGYKMSPLSKRIIRLVFLLVLVSLAAHMLADMQYAGDGLPVKSDLCVVHESILVPTIGWALAAPASPQMVYLQTSPHPALLPIPFHPPAA
jgi:hypothetical protein